MTVEGQSEQYLTNNFMLSNNSNQSAEDTLFLEEAIVDSISALELVMFVEKVLDIPVEDEEIVPEDLDLCRRITMYYFLYFSSMALSLSASCSRMSIIFVSPR